MVERILLKKMLEILHLPGLEIPPAVSKVLAERIVYMSTAWADAADGERSRVLANHGSAILAWLEEAKTKAAGGELPDRPSLGHSRSSGRSDSDRHRFASYTFDETGSVVAGDKRKQSLYFPEAMLEEIKLEAARLDRSLSWVVQRAWKMARREIGTIPSVDDVEVEDAEES